MLAQQPQKSFDHRFCEGVQGYDILRQELNGIKRENHYVLLEFETQCIFLCASGSFQCNIEDSKGFHSKIDKVPYEYKLANSSIIGDRLNDLEVVFSNRILFNFDNHVIIATPHYAFQVSQKAYNEIFKK